jgi:LysR family transcriptional regulator, glycine cleavage system transcriptional activator
MLQNGVMPNPMHPLHKNLNLSRFPFDTLPGFVAAASNLSFTQAALDLQLSQSAISKQVKLLEEAVGYALFKRATSSGGRLELTKAGTALYLTAKASLQDVEQTLLRIRRNHGNTLSITTTPSMASLWLVPRLSELKDALGGIDVLLDARDDKVNLEAEGIDVAIRLMASTSNDETTHVVPLSYEQGVLVCSPDLVVSGRGLQNLSDLNHHTLLAFDDSRSRFPVVNLASWLEGMNLQKLGVMREQIKPKTVIRFTHYEQVIRAAVAGLGVAIGRKPLVDNYLAAGELVMPFENLFGSTQELALRYHIVISEAALEKPSTAALVAWLKSRL